VGWHLRSILAPGTRVALEHGGVAPVIVDRTADPDEIVPAIAKGGFYHAGQVCVSVQRVFVHESIAREFAEKLASVADRQKLGDPLDPGTDIGPLIAQSEVYRIHEWVEEALHSGAELLCGGNPALSQSYSPTVLFNPPSTARVSTHEVFGPVICIYPFRETGDAISRANSLRFAFQAAVFTKDIDVALAAAQKLNASAVMINDHTAFRVDWMPFGGRDESGIGIGGIPYSMREMTREKLIVIKSRELL
jgi:acyl-CoA reductase-like NAD-dependent aldehyde dehydrogenase